MATLAKVRHELHGAYVPEHHRQYGTPSGEPTIHQHIEQALIDAGFPPARPVVREREYTPSLRSWEPGYMIRSRVEYGPVEEPTQDTPDPEWGWDRVVVVSHKGVGQVKALTDYAEALSRAGLEVTVRPLYSKSRPVIIVGKPERGFK